MMPTKTTSPTRLQTSTATHLSARKRRRARRCFRSVRTRRAPTPAPRRAAISMETATTATTTGAVAPISCARTIRRTGPRSRAACSAARSATRRRRRRRGPARPAGAGPSSTSRSAITTAPSAGRHAKRCSAPNSWPSTGTPPIATARTPACAWTTTSTPAWASRRALRSRRSRTSAPTTSARSRSGASTRPSTALRTPARARGRATRGPAASTACSSSTSCCTPWWRGTSPRSSRPRARRRSGTFRSCPRPTASGARRRGART
mmetsp:Transcript_2113/g.6837  ORF Transcript_2113/g.6837 Transcript_2113/m.6837 type:complete len:264 (+) Transcript_2113:334-1125(+)